MVATVGLHDVEATQAGPGGSGGDWVAGEGQVVDHWGGVSLSLPAGPALGSQAARLCPGQPESRVRVAWQPLPGHDQPDSECRGPCIIMMWKLGCLLYSLLPSVKPPG